MEKDCGSRDISCLDTFHLVGECALLAAQKLATQFTKKEALLTSRATKGELLTILEELVNAYNEAIDTQPTSVRNTRSGSYPKYIVPVDTNFVSAMFLNQWGCTGFVRPPLCQLATKAIEKLNEFTETGLKITPDLIGDKLGPGRWEAFHSNLMTLFCGLAFVPVNKSPSFFRSLEMARLNFFKQFVLPQTHANKWKKEAKVTATAFISDYKDGSSMHNIDCYMEFATNPHKQPDHLFQYGLEIGEEENV